MKGCTCFRTAPSVRRLSDDWCAQFATLGASLRAEINCNMHLNARHGTKRPQNCAVTSLHAVKHTGWFGLERRDEATAGQASYLPPIGHSSANKYTTDTIGRRFLHKCHVMTVIIKQERNYCLFTRSHPEMVGNMLRVTYQKFVLCISSQGQDLYSYHVHLLVLI